METEKIVTITIVPWPGAAYQIGARKLLGDILISEEKNGNTWILKVTEEYKENKDFMDSLRIFGITHDVEIN